MLRVPGKSAAMSDQRPADNPESPRIVLPEAPVRPSEKVAFMIAESEELSRILVMASQVATLLERCEEIEHNPLTADSVAARHMTGASAERAVTSIRQTAGGVRRVQSGVLRELFRSVQFLSRHLSHAAGLALKDAAGAAGRAEESGARDESRGRVIELRTGAELDEPREVPALAPSPTVAEDAQPEPQQTPTALPGPAPAPERFTASEAEVVARNPLGRWVRALARFYMPSLGDAEGRGETATAASTPVPAPSTKPLETKVVLSGGATLLSLLSAYQAVRSIEGVSEVKLGELSDGPPHLMVTHEPQLDLGARIRAILPSITGPEPPTFPFSPSA